MSQLKMDKPSLPSIQFLLQEAPGKIGSETNEELLKNKIFNTTMIVPIIPKIEETNAPLSVSSTPKRQFGHRASRSVSSLPMDLQNLSLQAPPPSESMVGVSPLLPQQQPQHEPYGGIPFSNAEKAPSWMIPNDRPPMLNVPLPTYSTNYNSNSNNNNNNRLKPSFAGHGRSVSEFTLPPLSHSNNMNDSNSNHSNTPSRRHTSNHRRAVSANTIDFMLSPPLDTFVRAQSYSPQETNMTLQSTPSPAPTNFFEQLDHSSNTSLSSTTVTADASGRYVCPYCHKKFSRPSSLRIHTYSHTGEKPFVCTEPGCGRHFSVQSNMRRHLRVHRLGRGAGSSSNNTLETTNEE